MKTNSIEKLCNALRCLPGIGPKSAQRIVFHLLERERENGLLLAKQLEETLIKVGHCQRCRTFCENSLCDICSNPKRDTSQLCIVETPVDIIAIEHANVYRGLYFVLMGHLSPLDGIGPNEIGINELQSILNKEIQEIILATNPTIEGEATAHYISNLARAKNIKATRIAHGVPMGGELEYIDGNTISRAFLGRRES